MNKLLLCLACALPFAAALHADEVPVRYVNVNNYDPNSTDYNSKSGCDGSTYEKGFGTLAKAMRWANDLTASHVIVGPGVYDKAVFGSNGRCSVQKGMLLESMEGPEKTIIVGAASDDASGMDANGNGPNAVRCVRIQQTGCTIRGFTITGGHTAISTDSMLGYGGAVWTDYNHGITDSRIENCIITNNAASQSVLFGGTYINCIIKDNYSTSRHAADSTELINCLVTDNTALRAASGTRLTVNCTFGPFTQTNPSVDQPTCGYGSPAGPIVNSIFITRPDSVKSNTYIWLTNCFYIASAPHGQHEYNCRKFASAAAMGLDENYRPVKDGAAVGFASNDVYRAYAPGVDFTLDGVPRILNGNVDVGAYEYNWCDDFAAALGPDVVVTNASPEVTLNAAGKVVVPNGKMVAGYIKEKSGYSACVMNADPGATGTLYPANHSPIPVSGSTITSRSKGIIGFELMGVGSAVLSDFLREQCGMVLFFR